MNPNLLPALPESAEAVVIGGGAAGLNAAMMLGRSLRSVVVIDAGAPRNAPADGVHGLLGLDGTPPAVLLARGREEVRRYGGQIVEGTVALVSGEVDAFTVELTDGQRVGARRVVVATGLVDVLPEIPGLAEGWGRDVLHCPYCHGWEIRGRALGVIANGPMSVHQALLFSQLTDDLVYFAGTTVPDSEQAGLLAACGVTVVHGPVDEVVRADGRVVGVRVGDDVIARDTIAVATRMVARADFVAGVGLVPVEHPSGMGENLPADEFGRTDVPGIWVAGNVTDLSAQVGAAAAAGARAGAQVNADLVMADANAGLAALAG